MEFKPEILQLAALRQSKGISLESIADQTKISRYYLRAIENLDLAKLPAGVYRDNFLKQYALSIDGDIAEDLQRKLAKAAREADEAQAKATANSGMVRLLKELLAKGVALLCLFGDGNGIFGQSAVASQTENRNDPRSHALRNFFDRHKCPISNYVEEFLDAADKQGLDWRLLPSIAFLESTGGKHLSGGNLLGWGSGKVKFQTTKQAIQFVAERLAKSPTYANKDVKAKLRTYNPARKDYAKRVIEVMEQLGPTLLASR
jgi:transcriptional regulator with XRE-family HTH domain